MQLVDYPLLEAEGDRLEVRFVTTCRKNGLARTTSSVGPGFEPITFRLEKVLVDELHDSKGRRISTVRAVVISETEEEQEASAAREEENQVLVAAARRRAFHVRSQISLGCSAGSFTDGRPYKSKVW